MDRKNRKGAQRPKTAAVASLPSDFVSTDLDAICSNKAFEPVDSCSFFRQDSTVTVYSQDDEPTFELIGDSSATFMTGTEFRSELELVKEIGQGSESKVFLCRIKGSEELVTLKQYKSDDTTQESEFEMLMGLNHKNIVKHFCLCKSNQGDFGIIMEYMPGGSLEKYIEENFDKITFEEKKEIIKQILSGLDYLHKNKIIHRDLKPANILLSADRKTIKITDFGCSKKTVADSMIQRSFIGTAWYMAPEVINSEEYSSKADIWSLGCCVFHLITGQKPYHEANQFKALNLMSNCENLLGECSPETLAKINEHRGIKEFLQLCFNRNKIERPTASELLNHSIFREI